VMTVIYAFRIAQIKLYQKKAKEVKQWPL
jgi:hypothetical protein